jgi:hypothetical protein
MNRIVFASWIVAFVASVACPGLSQDALAVRIETSEEGLYRISGERLKAFFPLEKINPERLSMTHGGQPVPIEVFGASDGHFDPADEILFFAERPARRHTSTETYVLTQGGQAMRLKAGPQPSGNVSPGEEIHVVAHSPPGSVYDPLATVRQDVIRGPMPSPWFSAALAPRRGRARGDRSPQPATDPSSGSVTVVLDPRPIRELPARIRIEVFGALANGVAQKLGVEINGTELPPVTWDTPLRKSFLVNIPPKVLLRDTNVRFTNLSEVPSYSEPGNELSSHRRNDILIERFSILYDAQLAGPSVSGQQLVAKLPPSEAGTPRALRIERRQNDNYLVVEPRSGRLWRSPVVEVAGDREVTLAVCSVGGARRPFDDAIKPLRPTRAHLSGEGGDYVIVTTSDLKPAVTMLADHRRASGMTPVIVEARELYDAFTNGAFHPAAIQMFLTAATQNWSKKPRYLLIVGDADLDCDFINKRETIPAWLVMTDYNGMTATDSLHGDVDADGMPDVSVGRIPVRTREDFLAVARRIISLETSPPPGEWRRTLAFVAGEGRFGPVVDKLLESQAAAVLAKIPAQFDVQMTYGSPASDWYWPAEDFNAHLIDSFNQGALTFTYIGHGSPEAFDHVRVGNNVYPILSVPDIDKLASEGRSPVMTIIACSTGRYDDPQRDCLAEKMLLREGGPIAVIAASRISHPYPNALLGKGISAPFFEATNRVGDAFRAGTRSMVAGSKELVNSMLASQFLSKSVDSQTLVKDHVAIYNLFGDPAQRVPFPEAIAGIEAPASARPGQTIEVKATPLGAGEAIVSIDAPRDRKVRKKPESEPENTGTSGTAVLPEAIKARHAAANRHSVASTRVKFADGALAASLALPADLRPGTYAVVIFVPGDAATPTAAGAKSIKIGTGEESRENEPK